MPGGSQMGPQGNANFNMSHQSAEGRTDGGAPKGLSDKVDLNDLEWEDRERVLRLLFSKMNAGNPTKTATTKQNIKQA